jgi:hypothetical protein
MFFKAKPIIATLLERHCQISERCNDLLEPV